MKRAMKWAMRSSVLGFMVGCSENLIREDQRVDVPGCDALARVLADAHGLRFTGRGSLTLQLQGEVSSDCNEPLLISHPQGGHLRIVGPDPDPGSYTLHVLHGGNGLEIAGGGLGGLSGLTLRNNPDESTRDAIGILVRDRAEVTIGRGLIVRDFPIGLRAAYGAMLSVPSPTLEDGLVLISGSSTYGVLASDGSRVVLPGACIDMDRDGACANLETECQQKAIAMPSLSGGVVATRGAFVDVGADPYMSDGSGIPTGLWATGRGRGALCGLEALC